MGLQWTPRGSQQIKLKNIKLLQVARGLWLHEVREGLRRIQWQRAARRRVDMDGIEVGIDRCATLALYRSSRTSDQRKGILRSVQSGAIRSQANLYKAGLADEPIRPID